MNAISLLCCTAKKSFDALRTDGLILTPNSGDIQS
ncbi:hypothetical protein AQ1_01724 [alpha proteobacterium Q-1]|nr:hypothetical protein AQ1_01724 [alpha proteobacterium Q-1]